MFLYKKVLLRREKNISCTFHTKKKEKRVKQYCCFNLFKNIILINSESSLGSALAFQLLIPKLFQ